MILFDKTQDFIVETIKRKTFSFYGCNYDIKEGDLAVSVFRWPEVKREDIKYIEGVAKGLTEDVFSNGLEGFLNAAAHKFAVSISAEYKGFTRVRARVYDNNLLRGIIKYGAMLDLSKYWRDCKIVGGRGEHEIWFFNVDTRGNEFNDWVDEVSLGF